MDRHFRSSPINAWDHASSLSGRTRTSASAPSSSWSIRLPGGTVPKDLKIQMECNPSAADSPKSFIQRGRRTSAASRIQTRYSSISKNIGRSLILASDAERRSPLEGRSHSPGFGVGIYCYTCCRFWGQLSLVQRHHEAAAAPKHVSSRRHETLRLQFLRERLWITFHSCTLRERGASICRIELRRFL